MQSISENKLLDSYKAELISFIKAHPEYFDKAVELAVSDKQPYSWRAAYVLWSVIEEITGEYKSI